MLFVLRSEQAVPSSAGFRVLASVFVGISLDGYIARPDGAFDFLRAAEGEPHGYDEFIATVDALLIGRKTYEVVLGMGSAGAPGWFYGKRPVFVLSSQPLAPAPAEAVVERVSGEPAAVAALLDARGLRHVYVDGGLTVQSFLAAGLINRIIITRVPVLIGSGIPLFGALQRDICLRHVATRSLKGGAVQSEYLVGDAKGLEPLWK
jgi:dihydrofolate reductase